MVRCHLALRITVADTRASRWIRRAAPCSWLPNGVARLDGTPRPGGAIERGFDRGAVQGLVRDQVVGKPIERRTMAGDEVSRRLLGRA